MKRLYLICVIACISFNINAQNVENPCNFTFSTEVLKCDDAMPTYQKFATVKWDFSQLPAAQANAKIEIVPVLDCWEGVNGSQTKDMITIDVDSAHLKSQTEVRHTQMSAKCFKWRTVITTPDCTTQTDWKFHSFIPKKS